MGGILFQYGRDSFWFFSLGGIAGSQGGGLNYCGIFGVTYSESLQIVVHNTNICASICSPNVYLQKQNKNANSADRSSLKIFGVLN